jgi:glucokinase
LSLAISHLIQDYLAMLLAGDLGGTKTILALFPTDGDARTPVVQARYSSRDFPSLARMLDAFLAEHDAAIDAASFAVAGPVIAGKADVTNLSWVISEQGLRARLGDIPVRLVNDLQATAYAIPALTPDDLQTLHPGEAEPEGALAVIAPGTGLGEAYLVWDGNRYRAYASEGGHTDFAPRNELEMALLRYLLWVERRFGRRRSFKNAPRTLDLDIIFYGNRRIRTRRLRLPHPGYTERPSVLWPLALMEGGVE